MNNVVIFNQDSTPIPSDKRAQYALLSRNGGIGYGAPFNKETVDPAPLPWEYEEPIFLPSFIPEPEIINPDEAALIEKTVNVLLPIFEDIVVAGLISTRWTRADANKSSYFKCYHRYSSRDKNGPQLAERMGRPRVIPQRYAKKYSAKKRTYCLSRRRKAFETILTRTLWNEMEANSMFDTAIEMYRILRTFLDAMIKSAPWDSYESYEICADIYSDTPSPYATQLLCAHGCARHAVETVFSLIKILKTMENSNETHTS